MYNILHTEWSDGWGGQEKRILLEATEFQKRGHYVVLASTGESEIGKRAREAGIPTVTIPMRHSFDLSASFRIFRLIKEKGIEIVNTHSSVDSWVASFSAKLARSPILIRTRHLSVPISTNPLNFIYRLPDAIITTGESIKERMVKINKLDNSKIFSIPTGVKLEEFDPNINGQYLKKELGIDGITPIVTMVAVLRSWKRHEIFLDAARLVLKDFPKAKFLIVGEGPRRKNVEAKIEELGINDFTIMTGHREDIPEILSISDISVLTSESSEGVPQALIQAMAMARPVVATNAGGIPEIVSDGQTGMLIEPNDADKLAKSILRLLKDREFAQRIGNNARKLVEYRFSCDAMIDRITNLYKTILSKKRGKP
ncbi:MAG: glycosyltransferase family 4 protein [Desulfobacterales bacterium]|nr:glycosyltransferase family 4 protein [Desulfobacterales bacterium]